jgi:hypothetical protein
MLSIASLCVMHTWRKHLAFLTDCNRALIAPICCITDVIAEPSQIYRATSLDLGFELLQAEPSTKLNTNDEATNTAIDSSLVAVVTAASAIAYRLIAVGTAAPLPERLADRLQAIATAAQHIVSMRLAPLPKRL